MASAPSRAVSILENPGRADAILKSTADLRRENPSHDIDCATALFLSGQDGTQWDYIKQPRTGHNDLESLHLGDVGWRGALPTYFVNNDPYSPVRVCTWNTVCSLTRISAAKVAVDSQYARALNRCKAKHTANQFNVYCGPKSIFDSRVQCILTLANDRHQGGREVSQSDIGLLHAHHCQRYNYREFSVNTEDGSVSLEFEPIPQPPPPGDETLDADWLDAVEPPAHAHDPDFYPEALDQPSSTQQSSTSSKMLFFDEVDDVPPYIAEMLRRRTDGVAVLNRPEVQTMPSYEGPPQP